MLTVPVPIQTSSEDRQCCHKPAVISICWFFKIFWPIRICFSPFHYFLLVDFFAPPGFLVERADLELVFTVDRSPGSRPWISSLIFHVIHKHHVKKISRFFICRICLMLMLAELEIIHITRLLVPTLAANMLFWTLLWQGREDTSTNSVWQKSRGFPQIDVYE